MRDSLPTNITSLPVSLWEKYVMAVDEVTDRLNRITRVLQEAGVPYALVGGQAVILWVSTKDPAATRTTKDVDILLRKADLPRARAAARATNLDYFEVMGIGMFLEQANPSPRKGVHILWAGEKVRPEDALPAPTLDECQPLPPGLQVVSLQSLVAMKLMANRDHDRVHVRDMIDVGLIDRSVLSKLPPELAARLEPILTDMGK